MSRGRDVITIASSLAPTDAISSHSYPIQSQEPGTGGRKLNGRRPKGRAPMAVTCHRKKFPATRHLELPPAT
jgi:hypothetical protein